MTKDIELGSIIDRLKQELGLKYDVELSKFLGKDKKYISVIRGAGTFGGRVWVKIFNIAEKRDISLDWLIFGKSGRSMSAVDVAKTAIQNTVTDEKKRNETVRRLSEAIVTHRSLQKEKQSDDLLDLASILINKLMS